MGDMELNIGDNAPGFTATAVGGVYGQGQNVQLGDFKDSTLVLYFYPKDETPGCTRQACDLRDRWGSLQAKAKLFGVSVDSPESHQKFIAKHDLPFPLISDPEKKMVTAYGVWVEKSMYGKKYMGTERTTFVIGPDLKIEGVLKKVNPDRHVELLEETLSAG
jgi:thioredoxin-dependent peroxiredoxin